MGTKTIYTCDLCGAESEAPVKWFQISELRNLESENAGFVVDIFLPVRAKNTKVQSFCGTNCVIKFISEQLPKFHEPAYNSKEAISARDKNKKLKEFLHGSSNSAGKEFN